MGWRERLARTLAGSPLALAMAAWPPRALVRRGGRSRVVVHVGLHKTGTTALQRMAGGHRLLLARDGVAFPRIGLLRGHHGLAAPWVRVPAIARPPGGAREAWARLDRRWGGAGATVLLSCENLCEAGSSATDMAELRRLLPRADEVRVVVVLRGQVALAQSLWVEVAKRRRPPLPESWVRGMLRNGRIGEMWADFGALHAHLRTGFAEEEIAYLPYEAIRAGGGSVPQAILAMAGVGAATLARLVEPEENVSPPALAVWLAAREAGGPPRSEAVERAVARLAEVAGGRPTCLFTRAEARAIAVRFEPLNARFAADRGVPLPSLAVAADAVFREDLLRS